MIEQPIIIRPSSLTTFADCARRFAARHLGELVRAAGYDLSGPRPLHVGAAVGSGVHAAAAYTLSAKRDHGGLGTDSEAEDRAVQELEARTEYGVTWDDTTNDVSTAKRQVARMSRAFRRHLAPHLQPLFVEERFEADLGDGFFLSGQPDYPAGDPDIALRDLKSGTRRRANGPQYAAYVALLAAHGYRATMIVEDFVARVRIDREQPPPASIEIDVAPAMADAWDLIDGIKAAVSTFRDRLTNPGRAPEAAFRANPASPLCAAKWCPAWGTKFCKAHL